MAGIFPWSTTPGSNTTVDGTNIDEGCPPGNVNNAIRSVMALVRATFASGLETFFAGSAALPVANGGTGGTTQATARSGIAAAASGANSDITSLAGLTTALTIAQGGTGSTTAAAALSALGIVVSGSATSGKIIVPLSGATFAITWRDVTMGANTSTAFTYGDGHTYSSWSRAWVNGDDGSNDVSNVVTTTTTTTATVRSAMSISATIQLFSIGV